MTDPYRALSFIVEPYRSQAIKAAIRAGGLVDFALTGDGFICFFADGTAEEWGDDDPRG